MATSNRPAGVAYHSTGKPGVTVYQVSLGADVIGRVQRTQLGAGQFGQTWLARTPTGQQRAGFRTRDAAAQWLVGRSGS